MSRTAIAPSCAVLCDYFIEQRLPLRNKRRNAVFALNFPAQAAAQSPHQARIADQALESARDGARVLLRHEEARYATGDLLGCAVIAGLRQQAAWQRRLR